MSANGQLTDAELAPIPNGRLRKDAAAAFNAMNDESKRRHGVGIIVRDSYRPLGKPGDLDRGVWSQWAAWERYQRGGNLAAKPGTSNHGWGTAIDCETQADRTRLDLIGAQFGWSKQWSDAPGEWWHVLFKTGQWVPPVIWKWKPNFHGPPNESKGPNIALMTLRLERLGYLNTTTWQFTDRVVVAVKKFQRDHHLAADGKVGPLTWYAIKRAHR